MFLVEVRVRKEDRKRVVGETGENDGASPSPGIREDTVTNGGHEI